MAFETRPPRCRGPLRRWVAIAALGALIMGHAAQAAEPVTPEWSSPLPAPIFVPQRTTVPPRPPASEAPKPATQAPAVAPADAAPAAATVKQPAEPVKESTAPAKPPARVTRVDIPLLLDRVPLGDVPAFISVRDQLLAVDGAAFLKLAGRHLLPDRVDAIRRQIKSTGELAVDDIRAEGLTADYDASRVEMRLGIPLNLRTTESLSLVQGYGAAPGELIGPADVSGYINFLSGREFVSPAQNPRPPYVTDFDGATTILGYTLEGFATYRDNATIPWQRGDVRFLHDDVETRTRYSVGDVTYNLDGFQSFQRTGGIAIARNFGIQPYRSSAPVGQTELNLDRNSRVDVLVNGQRVRTLDLAPGRYNVRDFPLVGGTNDITLRVTDEVGRVNYIAFPFVFDSTVLAAGEQDFSYVVGVPSTVVPQGRHYDTADRVISAYHDYGLTDQLTLGANYQGDKDINVVGAEARWATQIGTLRADSSVSKARFGPVGETPSSGGVGAAGRLQYRYTQPPALDSENRSIAGTFTYRTVSYASLGQTSVAENPISFDGGFVYGQRIYRDLYGSLGFDRQIGRSGQASVNSVDLNFSYPITDEITSYLLLSTRQASSGGNDNRVFVSISWFPRGTGHRVATSYDSDQHTTRVDYSYTPASRVDSVQADLSASRDVTSNDFQGQIGYTGYRFNTSIFNGTTQPRGAGETTRSTTVNVGTALAFADGHYALTRPITDSFALFAPHPSLYGQTIEVNPVGDIPEAKTDWLGPAVMPELNSYYQRHVTIDAPDLPLGYELGPQVHDLLPSYRSGILIPVGTGATVLGDGVLVDAEGKPLPLEPGVIASLDDPKRPKIEFFTNRAGRFRVEGLSPGHFRLVLTNDPDHAIEFAIPQGISGRFDLGHMTYAMEP